MGLSIVNGILVMCLEGNHICVRDTSQPIKYYESGKACYIEGVFHQSCPQIKYK